MEFTIASGLPRIPHKKHWQFCVGSGHALLALRTDYVRQLKFIHDTLGIERVRFHGIFDDDMRTVCSLSELFPSPARRASPKRISAPAVSRMIMSLTPG